jgi:hypothetical protein
MSARELPATALPRRGKVGVSRVRSGRRGRGGQLSWLERGRLGGAVRGADGGSQWCALAAQGTGAALVLGLTPELSRPAKRVRLE